MKDWMFFYLIFCAMEFIFFSVGFLMYRRYRYPILKVLLLSITPLGAFIAFGSGVHSKITNSVGQNGFERWLFVKKEKKKK